MIHTLGTKPWYADRILSGEKRFEIRNNYRRFAPGDLVTFETWDPETGRRVQHPLDGKIWRVGFVQFGKGLAHGFCAFAIEPAGPEGGAE